MKQVSSSELKAHMGRYIAGLRRGVSVEVTDRGVAVGTLAPLANARRRAPKRLRLARARDPSAPAPGALLIEGVPYRGPSSTELLLADRRRR